MRLLTRIRAITGMTPVREPELPDVARSIAIIMDGNGRWAAARGLPRVEGHRRGVEALRKTVRDILTAHPLVESFREGQLSEGGAGATVAALRVG